MMSINISPKCKAIAATVGLWLGRQDELTRAIHASTVYSIQCDGDLDFGVVIKVLNIEHPGLMGRHSANEVISRTEAFLGSEFSELSPIFSDLYAEFNQLYFERSLPKYRVIVTHSLPSFIKTKPDPHRWEIDYDRRQLNVHYNGWPADMINWLLHFMAHIKTGERVDGCDWKNEMRRLTKLRAPVLRPDKYGNFRDRTEELTGPLHVYLTGTTPLSIEELRSTTGGRPIYVLPSL